MSLDNFIKKPDGKETHFNYKEFVRSEIALRLHISNMPNQDQWGSIEALTTNVLEPIREQFGGIRISSGFRSQALNRAVGSSPSSNHLKGEAADIEPLNYKVPLIEIVKYIHYNLPFHEMIAEFFPSGWVHVAYREGSYNKVLKLKDKDHNYTVVALDYLEGIYDI